MACRCVRRRRTECRSSGAADRYSKCYPDLPQHSDQNAILVTRSQSPVVCSHDRPDPNLIAPPVNGQNSKQGIALAAFQQLQNNTAPLTISDRSAIVTSAGDATVKAMFQVMGNPKLSQAFKKQAGSLRRFYRFSESRMAHNQRLCRQRRLGELVRVHHARPLD